MRTVILGLLAAVLFLTGCAESRQQADMLAPRVAPAKPPQALTAAPSSPGQPREETTSAPTSEPLNSVGSARPAALPTPHPAPTIVPVVPAAARGFLQPMAHEYETWNNCAPVTAEMVLSYYGIQKRQTEIAPALRPNPKNFSVRIDQIGSYLAQFNLQSRTLVGGTLPLLKTFISNGIPVVVEDQLSLQDDYGHFRVARGYDDAAGVIIFGDSYFGPTNRLPYTLYDELWKRHNYAYMPVYRPNQRALVQAILGDQFDPKMNLRAATEAARVAVADHPDDGFAWLDLGEDLYRTAHFSEAIAAWQRARTLKLTSRTLWYTIWPAAAYNHLGQYQEALDVVAIPLSTDPNNAEALLERANAYRGLGNLVRARADYALALPIDPSLVAARQALTSLGA